MGGSTGPCAYQGLTSTAGCGPVQRGRQYQPWTRTSPKLRQLALKQSTPRGDAESTFTSSGSSGIAASSLRTSLQNASKSLGRVAEAGAADADAASSAAKKRARTT